MNNRKKSGTASASAGQKARSSGQRPAGQRAARPAGQRPSGQRPARPMPAGSAPQRRRKKKRGPNPVLIALIVALVLAITVFAGFGAYAMRYVNYNKILPNVYIAGIDVGGMTREQAVAAVEASNTQTEQKSVNVILPDKTLTFTPQQDTVLLDVDQAVNEAYNYGRASTNPFTMARAIKAAERRRNDIDLSTAITIDENYIRQLIDSTAAEVNRKVVESVVDASIEDRTITVTIGEPGYQLDSDMLYSLVSNAFASGDYSDINFEYDVTVPATIALDTLYEQLSLEPKDAMYDPLVASIRPEMPGYAPATPLEEANASLANAKPGDVLTFQFDEVPANVTADELDDLLFRDILYSYASSYASNANRTENLRLACEAIDGTILQPGEVFSFNGVVGERTVEKGYRNAIVYVDNSSEMQAGGGICQVASTIYTCVMYADLEIVWREPHMYEVSYVPGGLDATVYWGSVDFEFRNSTDYPLRIDTYLSGGCVCVDLVGTDIDYNTVEIVSSHSGTTYYITRYVYDYDGNLIRTDTTEDLDNMGGEGPGIGTSYYQKEKKTTSTASYTPATPSESPAPSTTPADPAPVDPAPVDPAPVDPAPVDPAPVDPAPVDPAPVPAE